MDFIKNHTKITIFDSKTNEETVLLDTNRNSDTHKTGNVVAGIPFCDVVDDSLDSFVFTLKNYPRRKPFTPFSLVTFTVDDGLMPETTTLFVQFDKVKSYSRIDKANKTYEHVVSCVESAKILEKTKIFNMNLTNLNDTLLRQFEKALNNAEPVVYHNPYSTNQQRRTPRFNIGDELEEFLDGKPSRDFYFGNTDLRTVLDEMLSVHNARITVENVTYNTKGNIKSILLGYISMNVVKDVAPIWTDEEQGEIVNEELENDGQNYAGKIVARGYNSIAEEPIEFTDTFKSANTTISDTSAAVFFPFPISDKGIKKFIVKDVKYKYSYYTGASAIPDYFYKSFDIDITARLMPSTQYDLLPESEAKYYIPYEIGNDNICFGRGTSGWFGFISLDILWVFDKIVPDVQISPGGFTGGKVGIEGEFYNLRFICSYYPQIDTVAEITKDGVYNKNRLLMGVMDSQTEQTLNLDRHGKKLTGLIQRTGNDEYYLDVKAKHFSKLLPLLSRIDLPDAMDDDERNYVLYKREYSIFDGFVNCRYYFSQNYNAVQENAGVNREKHLFDIPLESDETPLVVKKYLCFGFDKPTEMEYNFHQIFAYSALGTLCGINETYSYELEDDIETTTKTASGKIKYLVFQTNGNGTNYPRDTEMSDGDTDYSDGEYRFMLPTCNYALGKTMNFAARTLDNYSVSYARDGYVFSPWGDDGYKMTYNRYVDKEESTIGECEEFLLEYAFETTDLTGKTVNKFPVAHKDSFVYATIDGNSFTTSRYIRYRYYKDRTQRPLFLLSLECISVEKDKNDIIIGTEFARKNNLVRENGSGLSGLKLYVWNDRTFNGDENEVQKSAIKNGVALSVSDYFELKRGEYVYEKYAYMEYKGGYSDDVAVTSWAILDDYGNIFLACNGTLKTVYAFVMDLLV